MKDMTSRERVYATLNFREPDRVPICFGGSMVSVITECPPDGRGLSELYKYLGIKDYEPIRVPPALNIITKLDERLIRRFHSDMIQVNPNTPSEVLEQEIAQPDGSKILPYWFGMTVKKVGLHDEPFAFPMKHMTTKKDIDEYPWWPDTTVNIMEGVVERAKYLHEETDYFVVGDSIFTVFPLNGYAYCGGMDKWLTDMKIRPRFYHQLCEKMLEVNLAFGDQFWGGIGPYIDGAMIYDDLGSQERGLISLADYREFYKPYQAEIIKNIRKHLRPDAKIFHHTCGSAYYAIPDLIEIGVDVLVALQPLARNMEPWRLKSEFGGKIAFMGGFDIQNLLPLGSVEQVKEGVRKIIQEYAPGGGYILATAHNIEPDVPSENTVAMFDAAHEYGKYPISKQNGLNYVDYIKSLDLR